MRMVNTSSGPRRREGTSIFQRRWQFWMLRSVVWLHFFFQAEDGIRDLTVTGVQTCALPISVIVMSQGTEMDGSYVVFLSCMLMVPYSNLCLSFIHLSNLLEHWRLDVVNTVLNQIGRASCRERV